MSENTSEGIHCGLVNYAHKARFPNKTLWNSPGKNTGVGCHSLLHGIFPIQGSNAGLLRCRH